MGIRYRLAAAALLLALAPGDVEAHHPSAGFGGDGAGPIATIPAAPLPKGRWTVGLRGDWLKFDAFSDAELTALAASGAEAHSIEDERTLFLSAGYGLSDDLELGFHIPYVVRRGIREGHLEAGTPEVHIHGDSEGVGDLSLLGQYRFLRSERARFDAALLLGLKAPVGSTRETDASGARFAAEFQPGSGSWDPMLGAAASRRWDSASLDASLLYVVATTGAQRTDLGDTLHFGVAASRRWIKGHEHAPAPATARGAETEPHHSHVAWDFVLEATGDWTRKQTVQGVRDDNTGGTTLSLAPGVRAIRGDRWSAYLSAGFPILQDVNGTGHKARCHVIFGITAGF